jgi:hypothetical protein
VRYRKKPIVIEAFQLGIDKIPDWFMDKVTSEDIIIYGTSSAFTHNKDIHTAIKTLEGVMDAKYGDFIIKGVNGEIYPCKPDVFKKTYEPATSTHFERIKAMSVEEMAEYIYEHDDNLNDVICKTMYSECPWGDLVSPDNCLCCIKKWLEREVQEDEP